MWDIVKHFNKNKEHGEITLHKLPNFAINDDSSSALNDGDFYIKVELL